VQRRAWPFERFAAIRRFTGFDFLRDSSWMVYVSDMSGQFNLWRQRTELSPSGEAYAPRQLTSFVDDAVRAAFTSPVDSRVVFFADHHGTENYQVYLVEAFDGWPEPLVRNPQVRHEWPLECFSPDGRYIMYGCNEERPQDMKLYVHDLKQGERFCLTDRGGWYVGGYWSPDGRRLTCAQILTLTDIAIWLIDIEGRDMVRVSPPAERARFLPGPWKPDGSGFFLTTDMGREYVGVAFYHRAKGEMEWVLTPDHDIEGVALSRDGRILAYTVNEEGYSRLYTLNLESGETKQLPVLRGVIGNLRISQDGRKIGFLMTTPKTPPNIYVLDLPEGRPQRITEASLGNIPEEEMVEPELVRYRSFDGLEIPAFLYRPRGEGKMAAILSIHGGPIAQERPTYAYAGLYQYLVSRGIAVLAPNFRGSTGYGKSYERKIYHDWGGGELKDIEHGVKWLLAQDWVDPSRIGVFGASFGGFATLSCVTRLPSYWRAAVDIMGPSNLVTFCRTVPPHWRRFMAELVGDPDTEREFLLERSPITYVDDVRAEMLIIQGANDPRVVKAESDQMVQRLRELGRKVEYVVFEDEGHGFTKYSNQLKAWRAAAEFLAEKLAAP